MQWSKIIYSLLAHSAKNQQNKYQQLSYNNHRVLMKNQQTNENTIKKQGLFPHNYSAPDIPTFPQQYPENLSFAFCAIELLWTLIASVSVLVFVVPSSKQFPKRCWKVSKNRELFIEWKSWVSPLDGLDLQDHSTKPFLYRIIPTEY